MLIKATQYALWGLVYTQMQNYRGIKPGTFEIAREIEAPRVSVASIFQQLVRQGYIKSIKGKGGGFYFEEGKPELTIKELMIATGKGEIMTDCFLKKMKCSPESPCPLHNRWVTIRKELDNLFSAITIQSLARTYSAFKMKDFFTEFRNDHRQIRDLVMDSITSIINNDPRKAKTLLDKLDKIAGPHFRFEEEALYPKLIPVYGAGYINKLYTDHDLAIARIERLKILLHKNDLNEKESGTAVSLLRGLLPHLSDCEGLTIMLELFDGKRIEKMRKAMDKARRENLGLLAWSDALRNRKHLTIIN